MASAVLAMAVVAVTQAVIAGQMQTADALHRARALELADALVDEVLSRPYCDPDDDPCGSSSAGPEAGESGRSNFDNMDDYHGFSESAGAVADAAGTVYPMSFQTFSRSVAATYGSVSVTGFPDPLAGLTVTVTVQDSAGATWTVTRFTAQPPS